MAVREAAIPEGSPASNRNFPISGQATKDRRGGFTTNWALAWILGSVVLIVALVLVLYALGQI